MISELGTERSMQLFTLPNLTIIAAKGAFRKDVPVRPQQLKGQTPADLVLLVDLLRDQATYVMG